MAAAESIRVTLHLPQPYSLRQTFGLWRLSKADPCLQFPDSSSVRLALRTPRGPIQIDALQAGDADLDVQVVGDGAFWIRERLPALFGLNDNPGEFLPEGRVRDLIRRHPGAHLPTSPVISARLVQLVLQQLVSWEDAASSWSRLVRTHGDEAPGDCGMWVPPSVTTLRSLGYYDLVQCGVLPRQARLVLRLAPEFSRLERLAGDPLRLAGYLKKLPGIGPWTIQYLAGSALGQSDAVLTGDYALPHAISWFLREQPRSSDEEMLRLLEPYRGHRFRVQQLILQNGPLAPRRGPKVRAHWKKADG